VGRRGGKVVLLNPTPAVAEVITTSGLTGLLPIERGAAPS
jgi:anti-anti-sigma regulatory factor